MQPCSHAKRSDAEFTHPPGTPYRPQPGLTALRLRLPALQSPHWGHIAAALSQSSRWEVQQWGLLARCRLTALVAQASLQPARTELAAADRHACWRSVLS